MKKHLLFLPLLLMLIGLHSSASKLDSLRQALSQTPTDTVQMAILVTLTSIAPEGEWQLYNKQLGEKSKALMQSGDMERQRKGKRFYAVYLSNLGYMYTEKGDYKNALDRFFSSMELFEEAGHRSGLYLTYNNIGAIYERMDMPDKAIEFYRKALKINEETGKFVNNIPVLNNIGIIYSKNQKMDSAFLSQNMALALIKKYNVRDNTVSAVYNNLGSLMEKTGDHDKAREYYAEGLKLSRETGDPIGQWRCLVGLAEIGLKNGEVSEAYANASEALAVAKQTGHLKGIETASGLLKSIYLKKGQVREAFEMFELQVAMRDSLNRIENEKALLKHQFQYEYDLKEAITKAEQKKKDIRTRNQRNMILIGGFILLLLSAGLWSRLHYIRKTAAIIREEKARSEELLLNILPEEVAGELKEKGYSDAQLIDQVTVLFTDFKGFTALSEKVTPKELVADLHECFSAFDWITEKYGIEKIKTIGDAYMAAGGLPTPNHTHAVDVVRAALEMAQFVEEGKAKKTAAGLPFFEIRVGIHTGPVVAGIVGVKKFQYDIWGDTVNTAARMENSSIAGKVNVSQSTYELLKEHPDFKFERRGRIQAKGKGEVEMYFVSMV